MSKDTKDTNKNKETKPKENLHSGHRERMRAKFIEGGIDIYQPHEIIEMILFASSSRKNTNKIAHKILAEFKSLHLVFEATPLEIMKRCGISEAMAVPLAMIGPLFKRYQLSKWDKRLRFDSTEQMGGYASALLTAHQVEKLYVLCLDSNLNLLESKLMEEGTADFVYVYVNKVVKHSLLIDARYVVLAHNHPSGDLSISLEDFSVTKEVHLALETLEIDLLDHFVCSDIAFRNMSQFENMNLRGIDGLIAEKKIKSEEKRRKMRIK